MGAFTDLKITAQEYADHGMTSLVGTRFINQAEMLKAKFDEDGTFVGTRLGQLLEALEAGTAAGSIGVAVISGVVGTTVQAALESLKGLVDLRITTADANTALALKEDKSVTANHVKTVSFNSADGKFTFTHESGATTIIDTVLEKVVTNFSYNATTQALDLTMPDSSVVSVPLSDFITETEFLDSATIDFSVSSHQVTAVIKPGSITDTMLSSALATTLQGYVTAAAASAAAALVSEGNASNSASAASTSAQNAATSEGNALTYKNAALAAKTAAETAETNAETAETNAETAAATSQSWAVGGTGTRAGEDTNNAKYWNDQAAAVVGQKVTTFNGRDGVVVPQNGDYTASMVGATPAAHETDGTKHVGTGTKTTPINADSVALVDSADGSKVKQLTWADLKTALTSVFAIKSHASSATTYGQATGTNFGHVKMSDATNSTSGVASGIAATPAAVKAAYDLATAAVPATRTVNGKALSSDVTLSASDVGSFTKEESLTAAVAALYGLGANALPRDVLAKIKTLIDGTTKIATGEYVGNDAASRKIVTEFTPKFAMCIRKDAGNFYYKFAEKSLAVVGSSIAYYTNYGCTTNGIMVGTGEWAAGNGYNSNINAKTYLYVIIG